MRNNTTNNINVCDIAIIMNKQNIITIIILGEIFHKKCSPGQSSKRKTNVKVSENSDTYMVLLSG